MHKTLVALAGLVVLVSLAFPFSPVSPMAPSWFDALGAGDALVTMFGGASSMVGALIACARHRVDNEPITGLKLS